MANITSPLTARPTIYKGVEMRSRLEAKWAQKFDRAGWEWEYEPCAFGDEIGQYLPDFRYTDTNGTVVYLEIKGQVADPGAICRRMEIIWSSDPTATLILAEAIGARYWTGWRREGSEPTWMYFDGDETMVVS